MAIEHKITWVEPVSQKNLSEVGLFHSITRLERGAPNLQRSSAKIHLEAASEEVFNSDKRI